MNVPGLYNWPITQKDSTNQSFFCEPQAMASDYVQF